MTMVRHAATDCSAFALGGTALITALQNVEIIFEVKDEDAAGIHDLYEYAWATKGRWSVEFDLFAEATAALMPLVGNAVTLSWNSGANTYSGNVLVGRGSHSAKRDSLQTQRGTLKGQGSPTIV